MAKRKKASESKEDNEDEEKKNEVAVAGVQAGNEQRSSARNTRARGAPSTPARRAAAGISPPASRLRSRGRAAKRKRRGDGDDSNDNTEDDDGSSVQTVQSTENSRASVSSPPPAKKRRATRSSTKSKRKSSKKRGAKDDVSDVDNDDDDGSMTDASLAVVDTEDGPTEEEEKEDAKSKPRGENGYSKLAAIAAVLPTVQETSQEEDSTMEYRAGAAAAAAPTNGRSNAAATAAAPRLQPIAKLRMPSKHTPGKLQTTAPAPTRPAAAAATAAGNLESRRLHYDNNSNVLHDLPPLPPLPAAFQQQQQLLDESPPGIANDELSAILAPAEIQKQQPPPSQLQHDDGNGNANDATSTATATSWYKVATDTMKTILYSTTDLLTSLLLGSQQVEQLADGQDENELVDEAAMQGAPPLTRARVWFLLLLLLQLLCWNPILSNVLQDASDRSLAFYKSLVGSSGAGPAREQEPSVVNSSVVTSNVSADNTNDETMQQRLQSLTESSFSSLLLEGSTNDQGLDKTVERDFAIVQKELLQIRGRMRERQQALEDWKDGLEDVESALQGLINAGGAAKDEEHAASNHENNQHDVPRQFLRANEILGFFTDMVPPDLPTKLLDTTYVFLWETTESSADGGAPASSSSSSSSCPPPSTISSEHEESDPLLTHDKWRMAQQELRQLTSDSAKEIMSNQGLTRRLQSWIQDNLPTSASCQLSDEERMPVVGLSQDTVDSIIAQLLERQRADQLGQVDYASLSAGASVIRVGKGATSPSLIDSLPLWNRMLLHAGLRFYGYGPEAALTPTFPINALGQCWAFDRDTKSQDDGGRYATLSVELANPIFVSSVVIEHVPRQFTNQVESAIQDFRILGHEESGAAGREPWYLGSFQYDVDAPRSLQQFQVANHVKGLRIPKLRSVTLAIDSNWGFNYSCLYRFRVQGGDEPSNEVVEAAFGSGSNNDSNSVDGFDVYVDEETNEEEERAEVKEGAVREPFDDDIDNHVADDGAERHADEENLRRNVDGYYEEDGLHDSGVDHDTTDGDDEMVPQLGVDEDVEGADDVEEFKEDDVDNMHSWDDPSNDDDDYEEEEEGSSDDDSGDDPEEEDDSGDDGDYLGDSRDLAPS